MDNLLENITVCKGSTQGGLVMDGSTFFSRPIDMSNAQGCLWIVMGNSQFGADGSSFYVFPQCSSSTGGTFVSLSSELGIRTSAFNKSAALDEQVALLDIVNPIDMSTHLGPRRYIRIAVKGCTGNANIIAIKYNLRNSGSTATYADPTSWIGKTGGAKVYLSPTS